MAENTSERWITPVVITVIGFLTGFFFVYLLRGGDPELQAKGSEGEAGSLVQESGAGSLGQAPGSAFGGTAAPEPSPSPTSPQQGTTPPTGVASSGQPSAATTGPPSSAAPPPNVVTEPGATSPIAPAPVAMAPINSAAPPSATSPTGGGTPGGGSGWNSLLGRPCTLGLEEVQAVVVRQGDLTNGQQILWKRDIGNRERVGRISKEEAATVVPLAFGFHPSGGPPTAAYVRVQSGSRSFDGVIPLKIGDRFIDLRPTEPAPASPR